MLILCVHPTNVCKQNILRVSNFTKTTSAKKTRPQRIECVSGVVFVSEYLWNSCSSINKQSITIAKSKAFFVWQNRPTQNSCITQPAQNSRVSNENVHKQNAWLCGFGYSRVRQIIACVVIYNLQYTLGVLFVGLWCFCAQVYVFVKYLSRIGLNKIEACRS